MLFFIIGCVWLIARRALNRQRIVPRTTRQLRRERLRAANDR